MFSVEWKDLIARDANQPSRFTFGVALKINGDIIFVYEKVTSNAFYNSCKFYYKGSLFMYAFTTFHGMFEDSTMA